MKYVVIGGAGAMGRITVKDLVETTKPDDTVVIADYDYTKAQQLAKNLGPKAQALQLNVRDHQATVKALEGSVAVINCAHHHFNIDVMKAAIAAKTNYVDLGGLFYITQKQLELDSQFKAIGKVAIIGMGAAPGIDNVLATYAAEGLDKVTEVHCRVGGSDNTKYQPTPALAVSYTIKTILDEFSQRPAVFTKGKLQFVDPMSGAKPHKFPAPVGVVKPMYTIHSEVATLPKSFSNRGVKEVSFKIAFDPEFTDKVRFIRDVGLASHDPIEINGTKVAPIDVVNKVVMSQPAAKQIGPLKQYEVVRTIVKGTKNKKKVTVIAECHTSGMPSWGIGLDIDTGSPPSIVAQMIANKDVTGTGVLPPEIGVPYKPFFIQLKRRKMKIKLTKKSGWSFVV
ncbi:MAG: saccharopine dehydrogenase NADP-binding domain-containing protein [Bacteriovoracia bacterium]